MIRDPSEFTIREQTPVFDSEATAIARIEAIIETFNELGQRRRILGYLMDKTVDAIPSRKMEKTV